jgi:phosphodiesterase/alkaline phosphatase D-like protein
LPAQAQANSSGISKVLIIMEENHGPSEAVAGMPYLMGLANSPGGAWLSDYYASTHPSTPNYIALTSGVVPTTADCFPSACPQPQQSVFAAASNSGNTAASFEESMPSNCYQTNSSPYVVRHNPWPYYVGTTPVDDRQACQASDVPLAGPTAPLPSPLPTVSLVTPNLDHDAHGAPLGGADTWLSSFLPGVLQSADYTSGALAVIVTFDESSTACGCGNNVINVLLHQNQAGSPDLTGGPITAASSLTHLDTYQSLLAVGTGTGTGPLLDAFFNPMPAPGVFTDAPSNVVDTSATLNGIVNPLGTSDTSYHFDFGTTTKYGQSTPTAGAVGSTQSVSASLSGLTSATTYHYRLVATNGNGLRVGADRTFTTSSVAGQAPTVSISPTTDVTATTATLNGMVNPEGSGTHYHFDYGTTTSYGTSTPVPDNDAGFGNVNVPASVAIGSLSPSTKYYYRLVAQNGIGPAVTKGTFYFKTTALPVATTGAASSITASSANLNGTVNPHGADTTYYFQYGTSTTYGNSAPIQAGNAGSGSSAVSVPTAITGLNGSTMYHYRLVAGNINGNSYGRDRTLTTAGPGVTTGTASNVSSTRAHLTGTVNPKNAATQYYFEYGLDTGYGNATPTADLASGNTLVRVAADLSGLNPSLTYHYRLVATNANGTTLGADKPFTTTS